MSGELQAHSGHAMQGTSADTILAVIAKAASDPQCDIDKMERLMRMYEAMQAKQAETEYNDAMAACQRDMPRILRDKKNTHTQAKYASREAVNSIVVPIYSRHGFALSFDTQPPATAGWINVRCKVTRGGHSEYYSLEMPPDDVGAKGNSNKTPIQARASSVSYIERYLTLMIFNIAVEDEDQDGNSMKQPDTITEAQVGTIVDMISATGTDEAKFREWMKVDKIADIRAIEYNKALNTLKLKQARSARA